MLTFYLSASQRQYLTDFLNKVSRSFAMVVPCLEEPLDSYMATAYLIFRVADNIEDCLQSPEWKRSQFTQLQQLLETPGYATTVLAHWSNLEWPGLTADEQQLMTLEAGLHLWQIYATSAGLSRKTQLRQIVTHQPCYHKRWNR